MACEAIDEFLNEPMVLPIGGRRYTIPPPSADTGVRVQRLMRAAATAVNGGDVNTELLGDTDEEALYRDLLGTAYDTMRADHVNFPALKAAAQAVMTWITHDRATAERVWAAGGDPNRLTPPNRLQRRSGGANTTPHPGSTSGTSTRPARARARKRRR
ncbi:hypothetical protein AB0I84_09535 [Streptomyces spectabilis]|uniref:DUF7426 family protein n=1 Tax=Streptomyces spectabilis TaxID=68270 RepID=UPI0033F54C20